MDNRFVSAVFGACIMIAIGAVPAIAADNIEATAQVCNACHGQNGVPIEPKATPIIWGQQPYYLVKQLHNYRSGERENPTMSIIAKGLPREDLRKLAVYFAGKSWPAKSAAAPPPAPPNGIAMCRACHQENFEGGPPAPRLAGLSYEYLVASMRSFATDERTNNGDMPKFMKALSESERDAIARYLSAL